MAFAIDRKLSAGVNASLQISSSELNRRLMLKSAASFRMRRDTADSPVNARRICGTYPLSKASTRHSTICVGGEAAKNLPFRCGRLHAQTAH